jgi:hypothetical protein
MYSHPADRFLTLAKRSWPPSRTISPNDPLVNTTFTCAIPAAADFSPKNNAGAPASQVAFLFDRVVTSVENEQLRTHTRPIIAGLGRARLTGQ